MENVKINVPPKASKDPKSFDYIIKKFKKSVNSTRVLKDYREKMYFETNGDRRKRKQAAERKRKERYANNSN
jgi:ribosomal protein S21